jgi:hypothetical protein
MHFDLLGISLHISDHMRLNETFLFEPERLLEDLFRTLRTFRQGAFSLGEAHSHLDGEMLHAGMAGFSPSRNNILCFQG